MTTGSFFFSFTNSLCQLLLENPFNVSAPGPELYRQCLQTLVEQRSVGTGIKEIMARYDGIRGTRPCSFLKGPVKVLAFITLLSNFFTASRRPFAELRLAASFNMCGSLLRPWN